MTGRRRGIDDDWVNKEDEPDVEEVPERPLPGLPPESIDKRDTYNRDNPETGGDANSRNDVETCREASNPLCIPSPRPTPSCVRERG